MVNKTGKMLEHRIEANFCTALSRWALEHDVLVEILKLNVKGRRGWPDRLILWQGGHSLFIEFKRPDEEPRKLQSYIHGILREMGFKVEVHDDSEHALNSIQTKIRATTSAIKGDGDGSEAGGLPAFSETWTWEDGSSVEGVRRPEETGDG